MIANLMMIKKIRSKNCASMRKIKHKARKKLFQKNFNIDGNLVLFLHRKGRYDVKNKSIMERKKIAKSQT